MKYLFILTLFLVACGKNEKTEVEVKCADQVFPFDWKYRDGITRKSSLIMCSNGCATYYSVDDNSITETICQ